MNRRHILAAAGLLAAPRVQAQAAEWSPDRPIRLVYPYPPGGGGDIVSRMVAEKARDLLGQPLLVENRPGAAGLVGAELVTRAPKDGYTLLVTAAALSIAPSVYRRITFDPTKDLAAVALLTRLPLMVLTRPESPLRSFEDLVAAARLDETLSAGWVSIPVLESGGFACSGPCAQ